MALSSISFISNHISLFPGSPQKVAAETSLKIREAICYNQGEYAQYNFLTSLKHMALKNELNKVAPDIKVVAHCFDQLEKFLNERFKKICLKNFDLIQSFYEGRNDKLPRVCLKANYDKNNSKAIAVLFRNKKVGYNSDCLVNENTGFHHVSENGSFYICNDIPADARIGEYKNKKLNPIAAKNYQKPNFFNKKKYCPDGYDKRWCDCWEGFISKDGKTRCPRPRESCYKSTLIIPLTFWNNHLEYDFLNAFGMKDEEVRTIFGYLCLDHPDTDYFNIGVDVNIGYIFADILSLYLITRLTYTLGSKSYDKACNLIG